MASPSRANTGAGIGAFAPILIVCGTLVISLLLAFSLSQTSSFYVLGGLIGFLVLLASFFSPEFGVALLIISMLLSPEFGAGGAGSGGSVETSRSIVIRIDDILLIILMISWFGRTAIHKDLGLILKNPLNRPIGLYVLSCFISTLLGYMAGSVTGKVGIFFVLRYIEYFIVFFISINVLDSPHKMRRFMKIAFFTSIAIAMYGMFQIPSGVRVSAPFEGDNGEPNTMGGYLLLLMCMAGGQLLVTKSHRMAICWSAYIFFLLIPVLFTGSRSSWLGIPVAMLAFFVFSTKKRQIATLTIALAVLGPAMLPGTVKDRLLFTFQQEKQTRSQVKQIEVGAVRLDTSTSARLQSYQVAITGWKEKPLLGWGVTGYVFIDSQFIRTLVETGLLGFGAFLWLVWGYLQGGLIAIRSASDRFQRGIALGYLAGLFGLLAHSTGSNTFIILRIMEPWMVFTAFVIRIPMLQTARDKKWEGTDLEWKDDEGKPQTETPPEDAVPEKPEIKIGSRGQIIMVQPESADRKESRIATLGKRFKRIFTTYENFLRREQLEIMRRERETQENQSAAPQFRRLQRDKAASASGISHRPGSASNSEMNREKSQGQTETSPAAATADPPSLPPRLRGIDIARGIKLPRDRD